MAKFYTTELNLPYQRWHPLCLWVPCCHSRKQGCTWFFLQILLLLGHLEFGRIFTILFHYDIIISASWFGIFTRYCKLVQRILVCLLFLLIKRLACIWFLPQKLRLVHLSLGFVIFTKDHKLVLKTLLCSKSKFTHLLICISVIKKQKRLHTLSEIKISLI